MIAQNDGIDENNPSREGEPMQLVIGDPLKPRWLPKRVSILDFSL